LVIERVTNRMLVDLMQERLWQSLSAESGFH
jgi:hypothetical protein